MHVIKCGVFPFPSFPFLNYPSSPSPLFYNSIYKTSPPFLTPHPHQYISSFLFFFYFHFSPPQALRFCALITYHLRITRAPVCPPSRPPIHKVAFLSSCTVCASTYACGPADFLPTTTHPRTSKQAASSSSKIPTLFLFHSIHHPIPAHAAQLATTSHDNSGDVDIHLDALMRQDATTIDIDLITNSHIIAQHTNILETRPATHGRVPAHDGALDPRVVLDLDAGQQHAALQTHAVTHNDIRTDGDVGADAAVAADLGGRVDEHVAAVHEGLGGGGERGGAALGQGREVQAGTGQEILGLTNIHPETLEVEGVQQAVGADGGEGLLLDGGGPQVDALQDGGVEDVDAGVDAVADELDGLLDEAVDAGGVVGLVDDDAVLGGLLDLGHHNSALVAVGLVEGGEVGEGVVADDVGVEDEEGGVVLAQDGLGELEGAGGAEGLGLDGEGDLDVEHLLVLGEVLLHDLGAVVDGEDDVGDAGGGEGLDLVEDHAFVAELDEGFREGEGLGGSNELVLWFHSF